MKRIGNRVSLVFCFLGAVTVFLFTSDATGKSSTCNTNKGGIWDPMGWECIVGEHRDCSIVWTCEPG